MSRREKLDFIARNASTGLHFMGTCAAGRDPNASVVRRHRARRAQVRLIDTPPSTSNAVPVVKLEASEAR